MVDTNYWEDPDVTNFGVGTLYMVKGNQYYHTLWHSPKYFSINRSVRKFVFHYFSNPIFILLYINPLTAELNPICPLLTLFGAHHIFHISWLRVNFSIYFIGSMVERSDIKDKITV
jgi:hypothetical protein